MDLDLRAIAGVLNLLLCWGTERGGGGQSGSGPHLGCKLILTFLPGTIVHIRVAGDHDDLDHEAVATLPDHVDHLSVADLHHVLSVDLGETTETATVKGFTVTNSHQIGKGTENCTSIRKSPILRPALQATPPSSTDSRYCRAGKAGVGVNSSMGV